LRLRILATWSWMFMVVAPSAGQQPPEPAQITLSVRHDHRFGQCDGSLRLAANGITYESTEPRHSRSWSFSDIRRIEIRSTTNLLVHTYGKPDTFDFRLREGEFGPDTYRLLAEHVERELVSRVLFPATEFRFELPAHHRHLTRGCEGVLRIGTTQIIYDTENPEDRRIWRIRDMRSFGTTGPYNLRLGTDSETFTFDLKEALKQEVYDFLWQQIYGPKFSPWGPAP